MDVVLFLAGIGCLAFVVWAVNLLKKDGSDD